MQHAIIIWFDVRILNQFSFVVSVLAISGPVPILSPLA